MEQSQTQAMHLQQVLSPQMQQSLQILQAPLMDLRLMVARELAENPVLEEEASPLNVSLEVENPEEEGPEPTWDFSAPRQSLPTKEEIERHQFMLDSLTRPPTLAESLQEQIRLLPLDEKD
ncbi:MAG: hypothetical protein NZL93_02895, partial [Chthoniobacterales bacterium]|nr:hypothetical protein [Chthoniobacterales bacterium]